MNIFILKQSICILNDTFRMDKGNQLIERGPAIF